MNGFEGYTFTATMIDANLDTVGLEIRKPDGRLYYRVAPKAVIKGDFTISTLY